jgi:hypothetical protein
MNLWFPTRPKVYRFAHSRQPTQAGRTGIDKSASVQKTQMNWLRRNVTGCPFRGT